MGGGSVGEGRKKNLGVWLAGLSGELDSWLWVKFD